MNKTTRPSRLSINPFLGRRVCIVSPYKCHGEPVDGPTDQTREDMLLRLSAKLASHPLIYDGNMIGIVGAPEYVEAGECWGGDGLQITVPSVWSAQQVSLALQTGPIAGETIPLMVVLDAATGRHYVGGERWRFDTLAQVEHAYCL